MASKQLSITITAVDQFTGTMRSMADSVASGVNRMLGPINTLDAAIAKTVRATLGADIGAWLAKIRVPGAETARALNSAFETVTSTLKRVAAAVLSIQGAFVAVGAAIVGGVLAQQFDSAAEHLDQIGKASRRLGLSVGDLSSLSYQAKLANLDFENFAGQIATAQKNLGLFATTGGGKAAEAFRLLNVRVRDGLGNVRGMTELLPDLADAINRLPDAQRVFAASAIFGDSSILQLLESGGGALRRRSTEAGRLGAIYTPEMVRAAEQYKDAIGRVGAAWMGVRAVVVEQVAPVITEVLNRLAEGIARTPDLVRGIGHEITTLLSGKPDEKAGAVRRLGDIVDSGLDLAWTSLKEMVIAGALIFTDVVLTALEAAGPRIGDMARDWFGPTLNAIPGVNIAKSLRGQMADAQSGVTDTVVALQRAKDRLRWAETTDPLIVGAQTGEGTREYIEKQRQWVGKLKERLDQEWAVIHQMPKAIEDEDRRRAGDLSSLLKERMAGWGQIIDAGTAEIQPKVDAFGTAISAVMRPPEAKAESPGTGDSAFEKLAGEARAFGNKWGPYVKAGYEGVAGAVASLGAAVYGVYPKIKAFNDESLRSMSLQARLAGAMGNKSQADVLALRVQQAQELREAINGGMGPADLAMLRQVHDQQQRNLGVNERATEVLRALTEAEARYRDTLSRNAQLVQVGAIKPFQATRQDQQAREALDRSAAAARAGLDQIAASPGSDQFLATLRAKLAEVERVIGESGGIAGESFADGLNDGFSQFLEKARDVYAQAKDGALAVADSFASGLSGAIVDTITRVKTLEQAFRDFAASVLRQISQVITKMLVLKAISGIAEAFAGGGGDEAAAAAAERSYDPAAFLASAAAANPRASGGSVEAGMAYLVGEKRPEVFVPGSSGYVYPSVGAAQRAGAGGGGGSIVNNISFTIVESKDPRATAAAVADVLRQVPTVMMDHVSRHPGYRAGFFAQGK